MANNGITKVNRRKDGQVAVKSWHESLRGFVSTTTGVALLYFLAISVAEALTTLVEPRIGLTLHGVLLTVLLLHSSLSQSSTKQAFLLTLALAPLVRLLSLSLPLINFPFVYWYALVGAPLLLAAFLTARVAGLKASQIGLTLNRPLLQILIGTTGIGFGYVEYLILHPAPLSEGLSLKQIWLPALILLIFTGLLEEIIFRGLMHYTSTRNLGRYGILYVASIFSVLHLGYKSLQDILFVFCVALFFSFAAIKTKSIVGVTLSHGFTNIGLFLIFPFILGTAGTPVLVPSDQTTFSTTRTHVIYFTSTPTSTSSSQPTPSAAPTRTFTATPNPSSTATSSPIPQITRTPTASANPTTTPSEAALTGAPLTPTITQTPNLETPVTPLPLNQIVVDDGDPGFLLSGGEQHNSPTGFGGDFFWATTSSKQTSLQAEWHPRLFFCGLFDLDVYIPSEINLTRSALYQIGFRQGMATRIVDQSAHPGEWVRLGQFEFQPTGSTFLRLTNGTGEATNLNLAIAFDAARWTYIRPCR